MSDRIPNPPAGNAGDVSDAGPRTQDLVREAVGTRRDRFTVRQAQAVRDLLAHPDLTTETLARLVEGVLPAAEEQSLFDLATHPGLPIEHARLVVPRLLEKTRRAYFDRPKRSRQVMAHKAIHALVQVERLRRDPIVRSHLIGAGQLVGLLWADQRLLMMDGHPNDCRRFFLAERKVSPEEADGIFAGHPEIIAPHLKAFDLEALLESEVPEARTAARRALDAMGAPEEQHFDEPEDDEVEVFRRISRESLSEPGDSVRIDRAPNGYRVVWGNGWDEERYEEQSDDIGSQGPADRWRDARLDHEHFFGIRPDTMEVWSNELSFDDLSSLLEPLEITGAEQITLNGRRWSPGPTLAIVQERGEVVFSHLWEGGSGMYGRYVYLFGGNYYPYDMYEEAEGGSIDSYDSLQEALLHSDFLSVSSATVSIASSELSFEELAAMLNPDDTSRGESISVNNEPWRPEP